MTSRVCGGCSQGITSGTVLNAVGQSWHPQCFACADCAVPITGGSFNLKGDRPICAACASKISGKAPAQGAGPNVSDVRWKTVCFECSLSQNEFYYVSQSLCEACGLRIGNSASMPGLKGGVLHPSCFKCAECKKVIDGVKGFIQRKGDSGSVRTCEKAAVFI